LGVAGGAGLGVAVICVLFVCFFAAGGGGGTAFRPAANADPFAGGREVGPAVSGGTFLEACADGGFRAGGCMPLASLLDRDVDESACVIGTRGVSRWLRR
jgi:hypothetical protein